VKWMEVENVIESPRTYMVSSRTRC
jgi:hypothetical protein